MKAEGTFLEQVEKNITPEEKQHIAFELDVKTVLDLIRHQPLEFVEKCLYVEILNKRRSETLKRLFQKYKKLYLERAADSMAKLYREAEKNNAK